MELGIRLFDLRGANALVPRLHQLFEQVRGEFDQARSLAQQLESLGHPVAVSTCIAVEGSAPPPVRRLQEELLSIGRRVSEWLMEVAQMGAEVKSPDGLVDFRSRLDGRMVYLCWRFPEPAVTTWHELEGGFAGRQPIRQTDHFEGDFLQ